MTNNLQLLQTVLPRALADIQQRNFEEARDRLLQVEYAGNQIADYHHLLALADKGLKEFESAERHFIEALNLNPRQPQVLNNLANLYKDNDQYAEAEQRYREALALDNEFAEAQRNLAICLAAQKRFSEAIEHYQHLLASRPSDASLLSGLGDCYRESNDYDAAIAAYQQSLNAAPNYPNALHNLGLSLHLQGELASALPHYKAAFQHASKTPEIIQSYANALHESGQSDLALELFKNALTEQPSQAGLHQRYNEILWELGQHQAFCQSYTQDSQAWSDSVELKFVCAAQLLRAGFADQALPILESANKQHRRHPQLMSLHGQVLADLGRLPNATHKLQRAFDLRPDKDTGHALVKAHLLQRDWVQAQSVIDALMQLDHRCQLTWALQGQVWRYTGNEQYRWLCNYQDFIGVYQLQVPKAYNSLDEFLDRLTDVLLQLHKTKDAPLQQTLRHGTQTAARLLFNPIREIQEFKRELHSIVADYVAALPVDPTHPLLSRYQNGFEFSGSWSVKLQPQGFHVNHVHPAGWISSSSYISIPTAMGDGEDPNEGAIKFGESSLKLGENDTPERIIHPKAGNVVLFPSYMWHGTYSFGGDDNSYRLTAPFDVVPV